MSRLAALAAVVALVFTGAAYADADPASDVLYTGRVFLPLSARVSPELAQRLDADTFVADKAGKPIRVALIAGRSDLGGVPSLFGRPTEYARFLSGELQFVYPGPVLVVMPQGAALAERGRLIAERDVVNAKVERGPDGLARAAIDLVERVSGTKAPPGFTVPTTTTGQGHIAPVTTTPAKKPRNRGFPVWASVLIGLGTLGLLVVPSVLLLRRRGR